MRWLLRPDRSPDRGADSSPTRPRLTTHQPVGSLRRLVSSSRPPSAPGGHGVRRTRTGSRVAAIMAGITAAAMTEKTSAFVAHEGSTEEKSRRGWSMTVPSNVLWDDESSPATFVASDGDADPAGRARTAEQACRNPGSAWTALSSRISGSAPTAMTQDTDDEPRGWCPCSRSHDSMNPTRGSGTRAWSIATAMLIAVTKSAATIEQRSSAGVHAPKSPSAKAAPTTARGARNLPTRGVGRGTHSQKANNGATPAACES